VGGKLYVGDDNSFLPAGDGVRLLKGGPVVDVQGAVFGGDGKPLVTGRHEGMAHLRLVFDRLKMIGIEIGAHDVLAPFEFMARPLVDPLPLSNKLQPYFAVGGDAEVPHIYAIEIAAPEPVSALELLVFHEVARDAHAPAPDDVQVFPVGRELKPIDNSPTAF